LSKVSHSNGLAFWGFAMGKDDGQPFLVGKEDQHHHHHHIISAENKQSLTYSLFAWNLFHGSTAKLILLCWFCPANLQGDFHHWFHNFEDLLSFF
jgi:hypothetical protein